MTSQILTTILSQPVNIKIKFKSNKIKKNNILTIKHTKIYIKWTMKYAKMINIYLIIIFECRIMNEVFLLSQ